ncbi:MAG: alpha/beta hydrolase, partial [Pseudomonadota bacterium]
KNLRMDVARSYYHWFFLAQPEPLPERLITADPDLYFASCLSGWGKAGLDKFDPHQLEQYRTAWKDPDTIRGMCNDYRATLRHDVQDDEADLSAKVTCPLSVLYGQDGAMAALFDFEASWLSKGCSVDVRSLPGGHFFIDSHPDQTLAALLDSPNT